MGDGSDAAFAGEDVLPGFLYVQTYGRNHAQARDDNAPFSQGTALLTLERYHAVKTKGRAHLRGTTALHYAMLTSRPYAH